MLLVGLTGAICSGRSSVGTRLRAQGIKVLECDAIYDDLTLPGRFCYRFIRAAFGPAVVLPNGEQQYMLDCECANQASTPPLAALKNMSKRET